VVFEIINASKNTPDFNFDLAIKCAFLHDTIEDTDFPIEDLEKEYGKEVKEGVLALTKNTELGTSNDRQLKPNKATAQRNLGR
jgi:(p)ppGpp synthase/HD superfamily hydrolase